MTSSAQRRPRPAATCGAALDGGVRRSVISRRLVRAGASFVLIGMLTTGCGEETIDPDIELGGMALGVVETSPTWVTTSVAWTDTPGQIAFLAGEGRPGSASVLHVASMVLHEMGAPYFPSTRTLFVWTDFSDADFDWSPTGGALAVESAGRIYTLDIREGSLRARGAGTDPTFTPDGRVVYVSGSSSIVSLAPISGATALEHQGLEQISSPRVSPDGRFIAFSALDSDLRRRVFVRERGEGFQADTVSLPDEFPGGALADGWDDDHPEWSRDGRKLYYITRIDAERHGIYVTEPASEPENPRQVGWISGAGKITHLRLQPTGEHMLMVIDGDLYGWNITR